MVDEHHEVVLNLLKNGLSSHSSDSSTVKIRFRPPYVQTNAHDARGDAIALLLEHLAQWNIPLWAAYQLSYNFVDSTAEKFSTDTVPFNEKEYEIIDATNWCKEIVKDFEIYISEITQCKRPLPAAFPKEWNKLSVSVCAQKNRKPKMEDRHLTIHSLAVIEPSVKDQRSGLDALFGVFDGHHGFECAAYAFAHLAECVIENIVGKNELVLKNAIKLLDNRLTLRCEKERIRSGTTVTCVYFEGTDVFHYAWCGDSPVGILQGDKIITITKPHKPEDPEELKRIEEAGGVVVSIQGVPRLNGVLNLSRSLGDIHARPMISSTPDAGSYTLTENDYVVFLASDGVWDCLTEKEIFDAVIQFISSNESKDYTLLSEFVAQKAKDAGAQDNLTLISVFVKPLAVIWEQFSNKKTSGSIQD